MFLSIVAYQAMQASDLRTEVIFSETANLTYHLDVMAGLNMGADPRDFQALWKQEFLKGKEDEAFLKLWAEIRGKYSVSVDLPSLPMQFIPRQSGVSLGERIKTAGLQAKTLEEYETGLSLLVLPVDSGRFLEVVRHFQPRFHDWWQSSAESKGQTFAEGMRKRLQDPEITRQIERFRRFYGSRLPDGYSAPFSLIYRPMLVTTPTSGEQLGRMSIVEFLAGEKPEKRLDVVLHEFCHFLYGTRAAEDDQTLQLRFAGSKQIASRPCYNLLNEGMATALGNGVIGRIFYTPEAWAKYLSTPRSFYNDPYIDRTGKRLLKMMDEWLPKGKTMNDADFVPAYVKAMKEEFGDEITSPRLFLNEAFIYVNSRLGRQFSGKLRRDLRISSAWASVADKPDRQALESFRELPNLSTIFVVEPKHLGELVANNVVNPREMATVQNALKSNKSVLHVSPRGPMAFTFLIVADSEEEASRRLDQVSRAKKLTVGLVP